MMRPHETPPAPPSWANRLLEAYCRPELLEEIQGDLEELYPVWVKKWGRRKANLYYWWCIIRFFRPYTVHQQLPSPSLMLLQNYFKTGYRNIFRNRLSSLINLSGLALGIACCLVVFLYTDYMHHIDHFHTNNDRLVQVISEVKSNGQPGKWGQTPAALGPKALAEIPQVSGMTRIADRQGILQYEDLVFYENIRFVEPDFFEMFDFALAQGSANKQAPTDIWLADHIAQKYFGQQEAVGKTVEITLEGEKKAYTVQGVFEPFPANAGIRFDVLMNWQNLEQLPQPPQQKWDWYTSATMLLLRTPDDLPMVVQALQAHVGLQQQADPDRPVQAFGLIALRDLAGESFQIQSSITLGDHPASYYSLGTLAGLILLLSCFNYINIALVTVSKRLREIGIRKALGGYRGQVLRQFLAENFLLCFIALVLGYLLAISLLGPGFEALIGVQCLDFNPIGNPRLLYFFGAILLITSVGAGFYPALYVSSFQPVAILKGTLKLGDRSLLTKGLLALQFAISFLAVFGSIVIWQNATYLRAKDWGYDQAQSLIVPVGVGDWQPFMDAMERSPEAAEAAATTHHISYGHPQVAIGVGESEPIQASLLKIGANYMETMQMKMASGRYFRDTPADRSASVIVNEKLAAMLGCGNCEGFPLKLQDTTYQVVGVAKNVHSRSFFEPMSPMVFRLAPDQEVGYVVIRATAGNAVKIGDWARQEWKKIYPDKPYQGVFQDQVFAWMEHSLRNQVMICAFSGLATLFLSCMGLFGLMAFTFTRKSKEYSIRKVLGANMGHLGVQLNRGTMLLLVLGSMLGIPLSYSFLSFTLDQVYAFHVPLTSWPSILTISLLLATALLTSVGHLFKLHRLNPVEFLRGE